MSDSLWIAQICTRIMQKIVTFIFKGLERERSRDGVKAYGRRHLSTFWCDRVLLSLDNVIYVPVVLKVEISGA